MISGCERYGDKMNYILKLDDVPFEATKAGKKLIEVRLNDKKRELIKPGDTITFENKNGSLSTLVVGKRKYKEITELVQKEEFSKTGGIYRDIEEWIKHIDSYYTRELQRQRGLHAIEIQLKRYDT